MVTQTVAVSPQTSVQAPEHETMQERVLNGLLVELETEKAENRTLLAEKRALSEQVDRLLEHINNPAIDSLCAQLDQERAEKAGLRVEVAELRTRLHQEQTRSTALYCKHQEFLDWVNKLFRNKTIPMACKLVLLQFWLAFSMMRPQTTGEEMRIGMQVVADNLGMDVGTVRRATDKAELFDVLQRRYETVKDDQGNTIKLVHITLNDVVASPDDIQMEKAHGGARAKRCPGCGSEDVDRYTVQHCRHCQTNAWYGQPGLRADANVLDAQRAQQHAVHQAINPTKKQDAFGLAAEISEPAVEPEHPIIVDQAPAILEPVAEPAVEVEHHQLATTSEPELEPAAQKQDEIDLSRIKVYAPWNGEKPQRPAWCLTAGCTGQNFQWVDFLHDWWCPTCRERQTPPLQS